jgi:hypothetical protein
MSEPLVVSIPHHLGRQEAERRLKNGLGRARTDFGHLLTVEDEVWAGDRLTFRVRSLGQVVSGTITVGDDRLLLEVTLPWLLAKLTQKLVPAIRREGTLLLERK